MTIMTLWLPIIVSAAIVFFAGAVIWMVMPWHKSEWHKTTDEEAVRAALKGCRPGMYTLPNVTDQAEFKKPEVQQKLIDGPQAYITIVPSGLPKMGGKLVMMFGFNLVVAVVCAYMVSRTLPPGADYLTVFRISGTVAFVAYGMAYIQESIWFGRQWASTGKTFLDALIYALLTGGVFGWLA
ncbi:MAG: hypothetical protein KJO01_04700 [Gammaproteobacteria bacterium]|nr:hypothetical protein [Gammaproteobacteria bacterium]MBT8110905.1 hypothetical protein [Gammaproteobacteria bacterium]NND47087.1 hypothetical protein [Woeseiaceae bacterium]NNL45603.1 hypothetical protein [Woeseiaceae bacterium]